MCLISEIVPWWAVMAEEHVGYCRLSKSKSHSC